MLWIFSQQTRSVTAPRYGLFQGLTDCDRDQYLTLNLVSMIARFKDNDLDQNQDRQSQVQTSLNQFLQV